MDKISYIKIKLNPINHEIIYNLNNYVVIHKSLDIWLNLNVEKKIKSQNQMKENSPQKNILIKYQIHNYRKKSFIYI